MKKKETAKRYILFIIGLFFIALGIAFTKIGELGVSPISSAANVLSLKFTNISMGNWLICWNTMLVLGQILILKRKFRPVMWLQFPLTLIFGYFTDFGMLCVSWIPVSGYFMRVAMVLIGMIVLAFGIALSVIANVIMNPGEMFVKVVSDVTGKNFGNVKVVFDILNVSVAALISLVLFPFKVVGVREGTLITMLATGMVVKFFTKRLDAPIDKYLRK